MPLDVSTFADELQLGMPSHLCIEQRLRTAEEEIAAFIHRPILKKLKGSPGGVRVVEFAGMFDKGVNLAMPKEVTASMKSTQAVIYHKPSGEYRMASTAHRTVLMKKPVWAYWL